MLDTDTTNPDPEVETTAPQAGDETATDESGDARARDGKGRFARAGDADADPDADAAPDPEPEEEVEEIDYEGKRYAVPKTLKDAVMRQADYTRKTQEVAAQRKQYEEAVASHHRAVEAQQADFEEYAAVHALDKYLAPFKSVDWDRAMEEDPIAANKQFMQWQTLNAQLAERQRALQAKQGERALQSQRESARREEEGREALRHQVKGWSPGVESDLRAFARERGVPNADALNFALHPQETRILYEAFQYRELTKKAQAKPKAPDPKPVPTVGQASPSSPTRLADDLPYEEWLRRREAQVRRGS